MTQNKYKILLVEDENNIRNLVATMLDTAGYQTVLANSCSSAKTLFSSYLPELVILDLGLPDADGMNFLNFVRKDSLTPIIVLSARANESDKIAALVSYSCRVIKDKKSSEAERSLKYIDDRLLTMPSVALIQVKKEMDYMFNLVEENISFSFDAMETEKLTSGEKIAANEAVIDFTNSALTRFLIKLSAAVEQSRAFDVGYIRR